MERVSPKNASVFERLYHSHTIASTHNKYAKSDDEEESTIASVKSLQSAKSNISGPFARASLYKPTQAYLHGRSRKFFPKPSLPYKRVVVIPAKHYMSPKKIDRSLLETTKVVVTPSSKGSQPRSKSKQQKTPQKKAQTRNPTQESPTPSSLPTNRSMDSTIGTDEHDDLLDALLDSSVSEDDSENTVDRLAQTFDDLQNKRPMTLSGPNHIGEAVESMMLPSDDQLAQLFRSMNNGESISVEQLQQWMIVNQPPPLDADVLKLATAGDNLILLENFPDVYKYVTYYQWLAAAFGAIDADGDQMLGKDEFMGLAEKLGLDLEDVFEEMSNGEGKVKWTDFCRYSVDEQLDFDVIYRNMGVWQDITNQQLRDLSKQLVVHVTESSEGKLSVSVLQSFIATYKSEWDNRTAIEHALIAFSDPVVDEYPYVLLFVNYYVQFWIYFSVEVEEGLRIISKDEVVEISNRWGIPEEKYSTLFKDKAILFDKFCLFMTKQREDSASQNKEDLVNVIEC